jgi:hypothetical protein
MATVQLEDPPADTESPPSPPSPASPVRGFRFSLSQGVWLTAGFVVLVVVSVIAAQNLQSIYNSQKDFVVGTLLSLTGFCFAKALTRSQERRAQEALRAELRQKIVLLERNVNAAILRIGDYLSSEAPKFDHYHRTRLLQVVIDDLDHCRGNIIETNRILGRPAENTYRVDGAQRVVMEAASRALEEAANRRDQVFDLLKVGADRDIAAGDTWDMFQTMTADTVKAKYMVDAMLRPNVITSPALGAIKAKDYVDAAIRRADQFQVMVGARDVPKIFEVMYQDLKDAADCLHQFTQNA